MISDAFLVRAQVETILETVELLVMLQKSAPPSQHKKIDEMTQRLTTMSTVMLQPFTRSPNAHKS
jgi:hypothetical protein